MNKLLSWSFLLLAVVGLPAKVLAHAVETNYLFSSKLEFRSTYSSGEPLEEAEVKVYAPNNSSKPWLVGKTDKEGRFAFLPDLSIPGDWEVQIEREGHEDILIVPVRNKKIEMEEISETSHRDVHYGSLPLNPWGTAAATAGMGVAFWILGGKLSQQSKN